MLKGVLHIHSTYSDGDFTLAELRDLFVRAGCRFACVTDHADAFDAEKIAAYERECAERSDAHFQFVPGLEYSCVNRMHILGYGSTKLSASTDPQQVIAHIASAGAIAVVAHPRDDAFGAIEAFEEVPHGIETWNTKYDGRYAPRPGTFALLARIRARVPGTLAFYGQDLHWRKQHRGLFVLVDAAKPDRAAVLGALGRGAYVGVKDGLELPSSGELPSELVAHFGRVHERSQRLRSWIRRTKMWADGLGIALPGAMKAQLRRIL